MTIAKKAVDEDDKVTKHFKDSSDFLNITKKHSTDCHVLKRMKINNNETISDEELRTISSLIEADGNGDDMMESSFVKSESVDVEKSSVVSTSTVTTTEIQQTSTTTTQTITTIITTKITTTNV
ncbi:hypothetical protein HCN44_008745 [Aphidius gifuensis]|uniref:Uncharacterized protein n=1 Tax=Aphidius gifuensis TaxID=684658 RepID=A0A835CWZ2_APHGI|nr:hypothetical protein HCN44_008745 [Aphidius gifuensis]